MRKALNRRWWGLVSLFSLSGFAFVVAIYLVGQSSVGFRAEENSFGFLSLLCPPLILTMAITHQTRSEVMQIYGMIGIVNAALYAILGMFIATAREQFARKRNLK